MIARVNYKIKIRPMRDKFLNSQNKTHNISYINDKQLNSWKNERPLVILHISIYIYIHFMFIKTLPVKVQVNQQLHEEDNLKTMLEVHWMQQQEEYVGEALDSLFVVVLIVIILF